MVAIAAGVVLAICLAAGVLWFFADPLHLPADVLAVLDQRASVVGMFTGMALGAAALVVSVVALRGEHARAQAEQQGPPSPPPGASAAGDGAVALGGDNSGIVSTGDGARNVQMQAEASDQGRVYQAGGDQSIHEGDDRRSYGGDHIEFHHSTFPGTVIGKQVNSSAATTPEADDDERR
ncbi:hypothetical protein BKM31_17100 [[Actinomadura] parvosata subsp. kistnae]|uniref:Uncharacterized protein n=1 Tax=[Actinomadura] parvosata subsp. kistnae TaxID=1909395 RepID=A0A1U9ZYC3_9ACTN|nr:hypothetical protein BKM31_17100 [Nonomuraea sp. ATCC 55076]